jgi:hypothetical protein
MTKNLPLANTTFYGFKTIKVAKGVYNVDVTEYEREVQPLGGNGLNGEGYPVPFIEKVKAGVATVRYFGIGIVDGPWVHYRYVTRKAARKAALVWLNGNREATEAEKAAYEAKEVAKVVAEKREALKDLKERVAKLEAEIAKLEA